MLSDGDTFEHNGRKFRFGWEPDQDYDPPWEDGGGRGIVSDWRGKESKSPGEKILCDDRWRGSNCRFYDFEGTTKKAKAEGWGLGKEAEQELAQELGRVPTRKQIVAAAVERDFDRIRGWCNDEWHYGGVIVTLHEDGTNASLWGIESDDYKYIDEVAYELADELAPISEFEQLMDKRIKMAEKV